MKKIFLLGLSTLTLVSLSNVVVAQVNSLPTHYITVRLPTTKVYQLTAVNESTNETTTDPASSDQNQNQDQETTDENNNQNTDSDQSQNENSSAQDLDQSQNNDVDYD